MMLCAKCIETLSENWNTLYPEAMSAVEGTALCIAHTREAMQAISRSQGSGS